MPIQYLNIYIICLIGAIVFTLVGIGLCYTGISQLGFDVYRGMELTTYYLDKNRYDLYLNGMVYCITFAAALLLLLLVILIPSASQIQRRMSSLPYGTPAIGKPPTESEQTQSDEESSGIIEPELTPQIEDFSGDEGLGMDNLDEGQSMDVVEGTGPINEEAQIEFVKKHTESAVKFLMRKDLKDKDIGADEEKAHEDWQNRGLSRGELRRHVLKLMNWESIPEEPVKEILGKIQEKLSE